MLRNDSALLVTVAQPQRDDHVARPRDLDVRLGLVAGVGTQLLVQLGQPGVGGEGDLAAEPAEQVGPPLAEVDDPLGIPAAVLVPVGGFLLAYAAGLWLLGSRPRPSHPAVQVVVAGNLLWVAASVVAVVAGWWSPTGAGTAFLLLQAIAVAVFAELQVTGLRRARSAAA